MDRTRTAIVTGASSGIGAAFASMLVADGYRVFDFSRKAACPSVVAHIGCDVSDPASVATAFERFSEAADHLDLLVCNAGFGISGAVEFTDAAIRRRQMDVNFDGAVACVKEALPLMRAQGRGRIVFTSSLAAIFPIPFQSFYCASKAAVSVFSETLALEEGRFGIETCVLYLGDVKTGFTDSRTKIAAGDDIFGGSVVSAVAAMERSERQGMDPGRVARVLRGLLRRRRLPVYKVVGGLNKVEYALSRVLPMRFQLFVLGRMYS